jgi:hypothetical protein
METNLSLEEIESLMPQNATEDYKNLIYSMNGYKRNTTSKTSISDDKKAIGQAEVYEQMAAVMADKNATPEDYSKLQDLIYKRMNDKSLSVAQGQKILNEISLPMQEAWGKTLKKLSADEVGLFTGDVGAEGVLQTLEKNGAITPKEKNKNIKDKTLKEQAVAARARTISKAYELYYQELQNVVDQTPEYSTIADIAAEKDISKKRDILRSCQNKVTQSILEDKFSFLSTIDGDKKPNKVLSGGSLNLYTNNADNAKLGMPVKETVIEKVGQSSGKFYALLSDGTTREISQKTYEQFLGQ